MKHFTHDPFDPLNVLEPATPVERLPRHEVDVPAGPIGPSCPWDPVNPPISPVDPALATVLPAAATGQQLLIDPAPALDVAAVRSPPLRVGESWFALEIEQVDPIGVGEPAVVSLDMADEATAEPELLRRERRTSSASPSFSVDGFEAEVRVDYSPPPGIRLAVEEPPPRSESPEEDRGWFYGLRSLNAFHPKPPEPQREGTGRPYEVRGSRPRILRPARNPLLKKNTPQLGGERRCRRCGYALDGDRCQRCGAVYCELCGAELERGRCPDEACGGAARCDRCREQSCVCGG